MEITAPIGGGTIGETRVAEWFEGRGADIWVGLKAGSRKDLEKKMLQLGNDGRALFAIWRWGGKVSVPPSLVSLDWFD